MKRSLLLLTLAAASFLLPSSCSYFTRGSVGEETFSEMMTAPKMAVTAQRPGWLLEEGDIHPLSAAQVTRVKEILRAGELRHVGERYYRDAAEGNRGDSTDALFYLYASNAQCLGGRVLEERVLMDDFDLSEEAEKELYTLLRPQLKKLLPALK
ncbi:MAG: hypothetical protein MJ051_03880 [Akkermansia sp.]|nr:hypothetical protein [Akkermansia sp.]